MDDQICCKQKLKDLDLSVTWFSRDFLTAAIVNSNSVFQKFNIAVEKIKINLTFVNLWI